MAQTKVRKQSKRFRYRISLRVTKDTYRAIHSECYYQDRSMQWIITDAITDYCERKDIEREDQEKRNG